MILTNTVNVIAYHSFENFKYYTNSMFKINMRYTLRKI